MELHKDHDITVLLETLTLDISNDLPFQYKSSDNCFLLKWFIHELYPSIDI